MSNTAWECPRCGKMNAPFNPSCFCKPKENTEKQLNEFVDILKNKIGISEKDIEKYVLPSIPMYREHGWLGSSCSKRSFDDQGM